MEKGTMQRAPLKASDSFLTLRQLSVSIVQGLMITAGCLLLGYYYLQQGSSNTAVRSIIFTTLLFSNIFLTLVNRSFLYSVFATLRHRNKLVPIIIAITLLFMAVFLYVPYARELFQLQALSPESIGICMATALLATCWIEVWKWIKRTKMPHSNPAIVKSIS